MWRAVVLAGAIGMVACIDGKAGRSDSSAGQQTQAQRVDMIQLDTTAAQPAAGEPKTQSSSASPVEPPLRDSASGPRHGIDSTGKRVPIKRLH
jgi:hypothetical protein